MSKIIVRFDSHQLSAFQRCPRSYFLNYKMHKEAVKDKSAFLKGNAGHDMLYHYYSLKIKKEPFEKCVAGGIELSKASWEKLLGEERVLILTKYAQYCNYYRSEAIKPVGVEVGFSKVFFEDSSFLFIYEGKIDFVAEIERGRTAWVDHKTQAFKYDLIAEVNQFMGYCWAVGYNTGMINYIGLQSSYKPEDAFRRQICSYKKGLIDEWYQVTLRAFYQMAHLGESIGNFEKHRTGCQIGKFGNCDYLRVCQETSPVIIQRILHQEYRDREVWSPWE